MPNPNGAPTPVSPADAAPSTSRGELIEELGTYSLPLMWTLRQAAARAFDPLGFRTVRALLLELIGRGLAQPKDLSAALGLVPPAVSTMISELEARGLITRQSDPSDGRRVQLELTEAGRAARSKLNRAWQQASLERLSSLSDDELELCLRLLRKLMHEQPSEMRSQAPEIGRRLEGQHL